MKKVVASGIVKFELFQRSFSNINKKQLQKERGLKVKLWGSYYEKLIKLIIFIQDSFLWLSFYLFS